MAHWSGGSWSVVTNSGAKVTDESQNKYSFGEYELFCDQLLDCNDNFVTSLTLKNTRIALPISQHDDFIVGGNPGMSQNSTNTTLNSWNNKTDQDTKKIDWNGMVDNVFKEEIGKCAADLNTQAPRK